MSEHIDPKLNDHDLEQRIDRTLGQSQNGEYIKVDDFDYDDIEQAAAMLDIAIAVSNPIEIPTDLAETMKARIAQYPTQNSTPPIEASAQVAPSYSVKFTDESTLGGNSSKWIPWMVAAASILIATVSILVPRGIQTGIDLNAERLALIEETPEEMLARWDWISTDDAAVVGDVIGDVVWSDTLNKGYMRISGLAINDPSLEQYQLWIFDATNPTGDLPQFGEGLLTQRPIDGGVFDIDSADEIIIEIDAKLRVDQVAAFAITVEPPGGVVVSDRSRVPLLALAP